MRYVQCQHELAIQSTHFYTSPAKKAAWITAYFCPFITTTESEESLDVTSSRTISMRYKAAK